MAERRLGRLRPSDNALGGEASDARWLEVESTLRRELGRGGLTLAEAEACYRDAPEEPLDEEVISGLVAEATRRARAAAQAANHWHFWIGAASRSGHGDLTLHVAGVLGPKAAVAAVCKTVQTPNWALVSVSSFDYPAADSRTPAEQKVIDAVDYADVYGSIECSGAGEGCWQFSTDVSLRDTTDCRTSDVVSGMNIVQESTGEDLRDR